MQIASTVLRVADAATGPAAPVLRPTSREPVEGVATPIMGLTTQIIPIPRSPIRDSANDRLAARCHENLLYDDFLDRGLASVTVESIHLRRKQGHQLAPEAQIGCSTCGSLLGMKSASARIHGGHMRDDHLTPEHCLDHVAGAHLMHQRKREICHGAIDRLTGFGVQAVQKLSEERLCDQFIHCPERRKKCGAKGIRGRRLAEGGLYCRSGPG
jgi:hypothetical protein